MVAAAFGVFHMNMTYISIANLLRPEPNSALLKSLSRGKRVLFAEFPNDDQQIEIVRVCVASGALVLVSEIGETPGYISFFENESDAQIFVASVIAAAARYIE